jgi:hypothetical protein
MSKQTKRAKVQTLVFITPSLGFEPMITALVLDKLGISFCLLEVSDPGHPNMVPTIRPIDSTVYIYQSTGLRQDDWDSNYAHPSNLAHQQWR